MSRLLVLAFVVAALGCGGKSKPATSTVEHADHMEGKDHHAGQPAEVAAFHDRLAPLWHAEANQARTDGTCGAIGDFEQLLGNLERAAAPETVDAVAWGERLGALRESIGAMGEDCANNQAGAFEAKFETVHNSYHALIEHLPHGDE